MPKRGNSNDLIQYYSATLFFSSLISILNLLFTKLFSYFFLISLLLGIISGFLQTAPLYQFLETKRYNLIWIPLISIFISFLYIMLLINLLGKFQT